MHDVVMVHADEGPFISVQKSVVPISCRHEHTTVLNSEFFTVGIFNVFCISVGYSSVNFIQQVLVYGLFHFDCLGNSGPIRNLFPYIYFHSGFTEIQSFFSNSSFRDIEFFAEA